jgi:predicted SAM-dependent methyltransferase
LGRINPLIALGIPTWGKVSITWARAYRHLGGPLGSTCVELEPVVGRPIAEARNTLMAQAIASGAEFLYMHGDDVLAPGNSLSAMLTRMRNHPEISLLTGVYWTREWPTSPYLWRGMQKGPFLDWKCGELIQVDYAGCDALMIRLTDEIKALGPEWFSTTWIWEPEQEKPSDIATEDFFFYTKCRAAGIKLWCDTSLQSIHEDRNNGMQFGLTFEMPQAGGLVPEYPDPAEGTLVRIADIGCGKDAPYFGEPGAVSVTRIDLDESSRPSIRADVRDIPVPDQTFDVVHSRHVLEHFGRDETVAVLREWVRILRVGGELKLNLPNALFAMEQLIAMERGEVDPHPYPSWQLYGQQADERDFHKNWFTPRRLQLLLEMPIFGLEDVAVETVHDGQNLQATARKALHAPHFALTPEWDRIAEREGIVIPGLAPKEAAAVESLPEQVFTTRDAIARINDAAAAGGFAPPDSAGVPPAEAPSSPDTAAVTPPAAVSGREPPILEVPRGVH